jgi:hypothetical protein
MKRFIERAAGYGVAAAFVFGCWAFGHYILGASDKTMMLFGWWLLFADLASYINKPDAKDITT